ncbi:MAG: hypothetical protein U0573_13835 [Phycisphaerales bacterium]|nr:ComF family protein [Planctomycetota bacterium]
MPSKPEKFTWPPVPDAALSSPHKHLSRGAIHELADAFDDVLLEEPDDVAPSEEAASFHPIGWQRWVEALEVHFLGRTAMPWHLRAASSGWHPDQPGDYCPRCASTVRPFQLDTLTNPATCVHCRERRPHWDRFIRLGSYTGVLAAAIRQLKFTRFRSLGEDLGRLLGLAIADELRAQSIDLARALLVPVPMTPWRRLSRGIDHTLVLTRAASRSSGIPFVRPLVRRHRPSQLEVPPSERRQNISGAFYCRASIREMPADAVLIVIDDVRTTGATMMEACRTLRLGLAEVRAVDRARVGGNPNKDKTDARTQIWAATVASTPRVGEATAGD